MFLVSYHIGGIYNRATTNAEGLGSYSIPAALIVGNVNDIRKPNFGSQLGMLVCLSGNA